MSEDEILTKTEPPTYIRPLVILGAGGIGGNFIAGFAAKEEHVVIVAIDDDKLELSNLNRIPVPLSLVGTEKTSMSRLTFASQCRRISSSEEFLQCMSEVFGKPELIDNPELWSAFAFRNGIVVVDARDTSDPNVIFPEIDIKLTYDGGDACCIEFNPDYGKNDVLITGRNVEQRTYTVTPSFVAPPTMLVWYTNRIVHSIPYSWFATIARTLEKNVKHFFSLNDLFKKGMQEKA